MQYRPVMKQNDKRSIFWLLVLYTLQGVPLGMSAVFPLLLKERGASYSDLAFFSMSGWPFALKLLWAPIVDGTNLPGLGRRKSWLIPCQLLIGVLLYYLSLRYELLLESSGIVELTVIFCALYFLAATQDIAVDGWALTMLSKDNVGYAGTCNSVGQTAGYFLAFSGFFGLAKLGVCTLATFMQIWAALFIGVTIIVSIAQKEAPEDHIDVFEIYRQMISVIQLKSVRDLSIILLTCGIPFIHGLTGVKFQDAGVSSEMIALLATLSTPVHIIMPWLVAKYLPANSPLGSFRSSFPVRIIFQLASVGLVILTPWGISGGPIATTVFYGICLVLSMLESASMQIMFTSKMTFFARVSDPVIGGTFMTVLNTISNIGGTIAAQVSYRLAELTTVANLVDGFYPVVIFSTIYGLVWFKYFGPRIIELERRPQSTWRVQEVKRKI